MGSQSRARGKPQGSQGEDPEHRGAESRARRDDGKQPGGSGIALRGAQLEGRDPEPRSAWGGETAECAQEERTSEVRPVG